MQTVQRIASLAALALSLGLIGCNNDGLLVSSGTTTVTMRFITPATVRSLVVEVSGPGIDPSVLANVPVTGDSIATQSLSLSSGSARRFVVSAVDTGGVTTHRADTTLTLQPDAHVGLSLWLEPLETTVGITVRFGGVRLTVTDTTTREIEVGDSLDIEAHATGPTGQPVSSDSLRWGSGNPAVVTVNQGKVIALRPGIALVNVSYRNASASVRLVVSGGTGQAGLHVYPRVITTSIGEAGQLTATLRGSNGVLVSGAPITWSTARAEVASVESDGRVTGHALGITFVIATSGGYRDSAEVVVGASGFNAAAGLLAHYPFSGDAHDASGNALHGTVRGATLTADRFNRVNRAYRFTTMQDIVVPNSGAINPFPLTISLWYLLEPTDSPSDPWIGDGNLFKKYEPAVWNGYAVLTGNREGDDTQVVYPWYLSALGQGLIGDYGGPTFYQPNLGVKRWHHFVVVFEAHQGTIYANGLPTSSIPWRGEYALPTSGYEWQIGGCYQVCDDPRFYLRGAIDEVRVYERALSAAEVLALYGAERTP